MREISLVFLGSGIGGVLRFILGSLVYSYTGRKFPYGTLVINLTGSFMIGFLYIVITSKFSNFAPYLIAFLLVGILGGYTTFSSFSLETLDLILTGKVVFGLVNIIASITLGVILAWFGMFVAKSIFV